MSQQSLANAYESPLNVNTAANDRRFATLAEAVEASIVDTRRREVQSLLKEQALER